MIAMNNASISAQLALYRTAHLTAVAPASPAIRLIKANFALSQQNVVGDFTEADYTGYVKQNCNLWETVNYIGNGKFELLATTVNRFAMTGGATANTIFGYWLEDNNGDLVMACKFVTAVPLTFTPLINLDILASIEWDAVVAAHDHSPIL